MNVVVAKHGDVNQSRVIRPAALTWEFTIDQKHPPRVLKTVTISLLRISALPKA